MTKEIDIDKPIRTKEGGVVEILCCETEGEYPIIAEIRRDGDIITRAFTREGVPVPHEKYGGKDHLINVTVGYVNVWREDEYCFVTPIPFATPQEAVEESAIIKGVLLVVALEVEV